GLSPDPAERIAVHAAAVYDVAVLPVHRLDGQADAVLHACHRPIAVPHDAADRARRHDADEPFAAVPILPRALQGGARAHAAGGIAFDADAIDDGGTTVHVRAVLL